MVGALGAVAVTLRAVDPLASAMGTVTAAPGPLTMSQERAMVVVLGSVTIVTAACTVPEQMASASSAKGIREK
jgi:hypothetical protein